MSQSIWTGFTNFISPGANSEVFELAMPHRGVIQAIEIARADGQPASAGDFTELGLYSSSDTSHSKLLLDIKNNWPSGSALDIAYLNTDGSPALPQKKLYLVVSGPVTSGHVIRITVRLFV